ncbi:MAG TPA: tetratricopeptide repeat protein [Polyangiaceae bacterium]|nr:tetratricopeptide repeat protein [Polyangiaceae bacterium]
MKGLAAPLLAVVALTAALYARTLGYPWSYLDDQELVVADLAFLSEQGAAAQAFSRPYFQGRERDHAYYRPVVTASFALDAAGSGNVAAGYRATNVLLHALAGCLLLLVLVAEGFSRGLSVLVTLAFVAHPALGAAVAWIPGRDDVLLGLFSLAAWLALKRLEQGVRLLPAVVHGACFFLALGSKETALALPVVFALGRVIVERRPLGAAVPRWLALTWAGVIAAALLLRRTVLGPELGLPAFGGELLVGLKVLVTGLGSLLLPFRPQFLAVPGDVPLLPGCLALGLLLALLALPGISRRRVLVALGAYVALALPSVPASSVLVLESRLYLPAIALSLGIAEIARCLPLPNGARPALGAGVVVAAASLAWRTLGDYADRTTFARSLARGSPHSALAQRNLGVAEQLAGDPAAARRAYQRALAADPREPLVHNNLAVLLMAEANLPAAEQELEAELTLHPGCPEAQENLARVRQALGKPP